MEVWLYSLISVIGVSLISLIGVLIIPFGHARYASMLLLLVSFSVGGLFGDAFIHLIPESFRELESDLSVSLLIMLGIFTFFVLEKFLCWRHCHIPTSDSHPHGLAVINIVSDGLHNLIDGIIIGASYQVSLTIGVTSTLAIVLHEIPQEVGDFGVLLYSGMSRRKALFFNYLASTTAILGTLLSLWFGPHVKPLSVSLLPFAAGGFIYLAGTDLIPELKKEINLWKSFWQLAAIMSGIGVMAALLYLG